MVPIEVEIEEVVEVTTIPVAMEEAEDKDMTHLKEEVEAEEVEVILVVE